MKRLDVEFRDAKVDGSRLTGTAVVFGQPTRIGRGMEQIAPGALDQALKGGDVRALLNHNPERLLGRQSSGTLRMNADSVGLHFEIDLPDTSYANDLRELVSRGDLSGASFGFIPGKVEDRDSIVTHTEIAELIDVSPVTFPAYETTSVSLRSEDRARSVSRSQVLFARHRALHSPKEGK